MASRAYCAQDQGWACGRRSAKIIMESNEASGKVDGFQGEPTTRVVMQYCLSFHNPQRAYTRAFSSPGLRQATKKALSIALDPRPIVPASFPPARSHTRRRLPAHCDIPSGGLAQNPRRSPAAGGAPPRGLTSTPRHPGSPLRRRWT
jgi:hypothetical protein